MPNEGYYNRRCKVQYWYLVVVLVNAAKNDNEVIVNAQLCMVKHKI